MSWPWVHEMVDRLKSQPPHGRRAIFETYATLTGRSRSQLYRIASANGWCSGRKTRADKGARKTGLSDDEVIFLAGIQLKTGRENKGPIMPVDEIMDIAIDNGRLEPGQISVSTINRYFREAQLNKERTKDPTPHTLMRSLHPNHVHLVDVSVCIQYYLRNGRMGIMDERDFYKNKPDAFAKEKQKLMRYVLTDHFSGYFLVRYYIAKGESRENLWDFLKWCWRKKSDPRLALIGVPFVLLMDAGSAQQSHAMKNFFAGLGIERPKGKPYNPRRQGSVERSHNIIETRFETRLRLCPAFDVDQLNEWVEDWTIHHCASRKHTRHGMTRLASWLLIQAEQLRELPDDESLNIIYVEPSKECTVRNYQFEYRGESFRVKHLPGIHHNATVAVTINPYRWQNEQVVTVRWQGEIYEVQAARRLPAEMGGFFEHAAIIGAEHKAQPMTLTQQAAQRIERMAHGEEAPRKDAVPFEGLTVFGHQADKLRNMVPMPRRGTPIEVARDVAPAMVPIMELFKRLRGAGVAITPALNGELRGEFGAAIARAEIDRVVQALAGGEDWRPGEQDLRQAEG